MKTYEKAFKEASLGKNIAENEAIILKSKNSEFCFLYAQNIKGANIKALEDVIIQNNINSNYNFDETNHSFNFAVCIPNANIKAHEEIMIKSNNPRACFSFAKSMQRRNINIDVQALSRVVLNSLDEYFIKRFYNEINFDKSEYNKYIIFM